MPDDVCKGCEGSSTDATHTCRAKGYPPVMLYGCGVQQLNEGDAEHREYMRQLMWAGYDKLKEMEGKP